MLFRIEIVTVSPFGDQDLSLSNVVEENMKYAVGPNGLPLLSRKKSFKDIAKRVSLTISKSARVQPVPVRFILIIYHGQLFFSNIYC